ncbi:MAG: nucleotidyl transferase AbiEii/AbiGii toxin family protein [Bacteroidales bacterium]|nr:nucleotidyl transferase AbiEii/AbiGii toxin family protein [Bacteroidales bacterium]
MIDLQSILAYYPPQLATNAAFHKHILKEYIELLALEHLSQSPYAPKLVFIGGTNLRLVLGLDRFSEDLDFDCKRLTADEFVAMTDMLVGHLRLNGLRVELRDKENPWLTAFRRNIFFPELLFDLNLTGHREERFLMKIEAQDQGVDYTPQTAMVSRNGFFFPVTVPSKSTMLSMKLAALLARTKGRDFYDTIFLWQQTDPDYDFLRQRCGIDTPEALKMALCEKLDTTDLVLKQKDFEHLLFNPSRSAQILHFKRFIYGKLK